MSAASARPGQAPPAIGDLPSALIRMGWRRFLFFAALVLVAFLGAHWLAGRGSLEGRIGSAYFASLLWATLVLLSFAGWGRLVQRVCLGDRVVDIGLASAWGLAFTLAVGSVLSAFGLATRLAVCALVALGIAALVARVPDAWERFRRVGDKRTIDVAFGCGAAAILLLAVVQFGGAPAHKAYYWGCDDAPAYAVFPTELLQTGKFVQPFSLRGLTSFGGQAFLNAVFMAHVPAEQLQLADRGACLLMMLGLVLGLPMRSASRRWLLIPAAVLVTLPDVRANLTSMMSGAVLLLALSRTLVLDRLEPVPASRLIALTAVAALAMRHNYVVPAAAILATSYGLRLLRRRVSWADRRRTFREALMTGGAAFLLFAPWGYVSYRSCGTFLYPVMKGNYQPQLGALGRSGTLLSHASVLWSNVTHDGAVKTIWLFLFAGLFMADRSERRGFQSLVLGSAVGFVTLLFTFLWADSDDNARYYFGYEIASIMAISLACLAPRETIPRAGEAKRTRFASGHPLAPSVIIVIAALLQVHDVRSNTATMYGILLDWLSTAPQSLRRSELPADTTYRALQHTIPEHERVFALLDEPFRLDFSRNTIYIGDLPGTVSPGAGLPLAGEKEFSAYLRSLSIRYFAYTRPENSVELYNAGHWSQMAKDGVAIHEALAPVMARVFAIESECRSIHPVLFDRDGMVVIDLGINAAGATAG